MIRYQFLKFVALASIFFSLQSFQDSKIDRKKVVQRHNVVNTTVDILSSLTIGNGAFAYTVDVTGMQSFPEYYRPGVALGTQSEWAWDSFKNPNNYKFEETLKAYDFNNEGRNALYSIQHKEEGRQKEATDFFRANPHRLQLGNVGLELYLKNGKRAEISDIKNIVQTLDVWTGIITSKFNLENIPVTVATASFQQSDKIAVKIESTLLSQKRIKAYVRYPYPTGVFLDEGTNYTNEDKHSSFIVSKNNLSAQIKHTLQGSEYLTSLQFSNAKVFETKPHYFVVEPISSGNSFELSFAFHPTEKSDTKGLFAEAKRESESAWAKFWNSGAAVDFDGSTDPRAHELERRIVLSQYLTRVQCLGSNPPQETGLTFNSWYGKPHTEMHWWHGVHFALWGRPELMEKTLDYYFRTFEKAKQLAQRQGYKGVRWIKMSSNDGEESPSSVAAFLVWQQPHLIYLAELLYRHNHDAAVLHKYKKLIHETAEFMADFAHYNKEKDQYDLGFGLIPSQEVFPAAKTKNPPYEVAYWDWALRVAQQWKERLGENRDAKWDEVIQKLAPLPIHDGVYLSTETAKDAYTFEKWMTDHPSVLGTLGMVPESPKLDKEIMKKTLEVVWERWSWPDTWGWDFPMTAMNAARLGLPNKALDALFMNIQTNTYLKNGHNYQDDRLRIYLPGNGGVLTTVAMMLEGWDASDANTPGFPKDGTWKIKKEGFKKMP